MPIIPPLTFPTYLLPPHPFRRRASTTSTSSSASASTSTTATSATSATTNVTVPSLPRASTSTSASASAARTTAAAAPLPPPHHGALLRCARCLTHLCTTAHIISKGFTGRHGRAYLVAPSPLSPGAPSPSSSALANTLARRAVRRTLVTGAHTVADVECAGCGTVLGWKYLAADEEAQRYKVGKFILEAGRVVRWGWGGPLEGAGGADEDEDERREWDGQEGSVVFDSEDEDECEDLFLGVWSEALAKRRRREKAWRLGG